MHGRGGRVVLARVLRDAAAPYEPFAQLLADDAAVASELPALAPLLGGAATADAAGGGIEVVDALYCYLMKHASTHPTMVVIKDLHWATTATRDVVRHVARTSGHSPLLLVATTRDAAPDLDDQLEAFLGELARLPAAEIVALKGSTTPRRPAPCWRCSARTARCTRRRMERRRAGTRCCCARWRTSEA